MSTVSLGAQRVASVERQLTSLGYRYVRSSASGRAGTESRRQARIPGDLIAFSPRGSTLPHLAIEVGGVGKRVAVALAELNSNGLPAGFRGVVARCVKRRWRFHVDPDASFPTIADMLDALRDA